MKKSTFCLIATLILVQSTAAICGESRPPRSPIPTELVCTSYNGKSKFKVWDAIDDEEFKLRAQFEGYNAIYVGNKDQYGVMKLEPEMRTMTGTIEIDGEGRFAKLTNRTRSGVVIETEFTCE